jgi:hypothetical protein
MRIKELYSVLHASSNGDQQAKSQEGHRVLHGYTDKNVPAHFWEMTIRMDGREKRVPMHDVLECENEQKYTISTDCKSLS